MADEDVVIPVAGMPATICKFSDREPVTVIEVKTFKSGPRKGQPREVIVQDATWRAISGSGHDGSLVCEYEPNPNGHTHAYVLATKGRRAGKWTEKGLSGRGWVLSLGRYSYHRDPHI